VRLSIALVSLAACFNGNGSVRSEDGKACGGRADCASDFCYGGICMGSECGGPGACPARFACDFKSGGLFGDSHYSCSLTCQGGCPERFLCGDDDRCVFIGPELTIAVDPAMPRAGDVVTFTATLSPLLDATYTWTFGDGASGKGAIAKHAFAAAGSFEVRAVADTEGHIVGAFVRVGVLQ
jgi:hypothetical protein